jgi:hypothetical protein
MSTVLRQTDLFLRGDGLFSPTSASERPTWWLPAMICCFTPIYGAVMGSYQLDSPQRLLMMVYGAVKLPLLLFATSALCLPGFFVLNTLLGLREDFREAIQAVLAGQAGLGLTLVCLGPVTRFWYCCDTSYHSALLFNAGMFTVATLAGHLVMLRYYRTLIRRHSRHKIALGMWLILYAFVGIQMGWILRPFVGSPGVRVTFFRQEPLSNAYLVVGQLIFGT